MSDNQNWQEQLQHKVGELLARRLGNFAEDLQQVQNVMSDLYQRLPAAGGPVTAEEAAGLQQQIDQLRSTAVQEAESGFQSRLAETEARVRQEYETQLLNLQAQLESAQQSQGNATMGLGLAAVGAVGYGAAGENTVANYDGFKQAVEEIDAQRQQADVLATLVRHASQFASRVVFFVIKSGSAIGWKAVGFSNGLTDETVRALNIPVHTNALLNNAAASLHTATANDSAGVLGQFASGEVANSVAVPLVIRGKAAALLYADAGDNGIVQLSALESLMHVTGMAIELLPVRRSQPAAAQPAPQPVAQPVPPAVAFTPPAHSFEASPAEETAPMPVMPLPVVEAPAEAQETMQAEAVTAPAPSVAAPSVNSQNDDEVRAHNDARRFARLLVSEIKLYNEQKVLEGRKSNDLYERLKEDIDRSRQMYEKRVSPSVSAKYDYFYDELLHTLGEGDAAKLGRGCPGPTVPVS